MTELQRMGWKKHDSSVFPDPLTFLHTIVVLRCMNDECSPATIQALNFFFSGQEPSGKEKVMK